MAFCFSDFATGCFEWLFQLQDWWSFNVTPAKDQHGNRTFIFPKADFAELPCFFRKSTLPKTNRSNSQSPWKKGFPTRKGSSSNHFQPSIFRCELLVSGRVTSRNIWIPCVTGRKKTCCWAKSQRHVLRVDPGKVKLCGAVILTLWEVFKSSQV